jgi:hypothetical protein
MLETGRGKAIISFIPRFATKSSHTQVKEVELVEEGR